MAGFHLSCWFYVFVSSLKVLFSFATLFYIITKIIGAVLFQFVYTPSFILISPLQHFISAFYLSLLLSLIVSSSLHLKCPSFFSLLCFGSLKMERCYNNGTEVDKLALRSSTCGACRTPRSKHPLGTHPFLSLISPLT